MAQAISKARPDKPKDVSDIVTSHEAVRKESTGTQIVDALVLPEKKRFSLPKSIKVSPRKVETD